jgi:hypothetical protein
MEIVALLAFSAVQHSLSVLELLKLSLVAHPVTKVVVLALASALPAASFTPVPMENVHDVT